MKNTLLATVLGLAMALLSGTGQAASATCTDSMLTQAALNAVIGMTYDEAAAKIGCAGTAGTPILEPWGIRYISITPYFWQSPNKVYELRIKDNVVDSIIDLSPSSSASQAVANTANPATFDAASNTLSMPVLATGGFTYTNAKIVLNPGGSWALTALSDASGTALPVAGASPQTPPPIATPAVVIVTGAINNYAGIQENTIFTIGSQIWRGKTGCAMPASSINQASPTTAIGQVQPNPNATIYLIGSTEYVVTVVGTPLVCDVERLE